MNAQQIVNQLLDENGKLNVTEVEDEESPLEYATRIGAGEIITVLSDAARELGASPAGRAVKALLSKLRTSDHHRPDFRMGMD